jgi:hypothetical protein
MKRVLFSLLFCLFIFVGRECCGQAVAGQHNPYQNLTMWYGTQSAPTLFEKAQWAMDDVNAYRESVGLAPIGEDVLNKGIKKRSRLFGKRLKFLWR